jgi:hypothetical protein
MAINPKYLPAPRGKHQLRFSYSQWYPQWEAIIEPPSSPFQQQTLKVIVNRGSAWEPVTEDELALIDRILDRMPDLIPFVVSKLVEGDSSCEDPRVFREYFTQAHIWLSERDEHPRTLWTFVVEKLDEEGEVIFGTHLEFSGDEFQEIWAGA